MRISPINLKYNQNMQLKKAQQHTKQNSPSFGHYESDEAKKLTYEMAVKDYANWSETKKKNFGFYEYTLKSIKKDIDYFENHLLQELKSGMAQTARNMPMLR